MTYGAQYAAMGVAALVIDVFGARRDRATGFVQRLIEITEAMALADAYAGLSYLSSRPEINPDRIALIGFSYGGMATTYAAHAQVAEAYAPDGSRFAAHVAYYAPCIARFADTRATGAPILFVSGGRDAIVNPGRCAEVDGDLQAGGALVRRIAYRDAVHQWDGFFAGPRMIGRNLAPCRFQVARSGTVVDQRTGLPMTSRWLRTAVLALCIGREGYLIGRDDGVRARANRDVATFLNPLLFP
jgi:dienelactone hydrolase